MMKRDQSSGGDGAQHFAMAMAEGYAQYMLRGGYA